MPKSFPDIDIVRKIEALESRCRQAHSDLRTPEAAAREQLRTAHIAGATIHVNGTPPGERLGRVYGFGLFVPVSEEAVAAIFERLHSENVTSIRFRVPDIPERPEIIDWLTRRGLTRRTFVVQWVTSTANERSVESGYPIRPVSPEDAPEFGNLIATNYRLKAPDSAAFHARLIEMPGMRCYMAFDGDTAVATGATYEEGDGCIVEYGTTRNTYRRQGLQRAMIGYRLNEAATSGCTWACASTIGNDRSSRNLRRQGFEKAYDEIVYSS